MSLSSLALSFEVFSDDILIDSIPYAPQVITVAGGKSVITTGDFNTDSYLDMAIANNADSSVVIFLGGETRQFSKANSYGAGHDPSDIVAADINGDNQLDLIISNHDTSHLTLLVGRGDGSFIPAHSSPLYINVSPHPHIVRVRDIDGDGKVDLIVDSRDNRGLLLMKGQGNSSFDTAGTVINTGGGPYLGFAIGDVNQDGILDFASPNSNNVSIVLGTNSSNQPFSEPVYLSIDTPFAVELADMNGDGNLDLIVASLNGPITIVTGDGTGAFNIDQKIEFAFARGAKRIAIGDINGDGISDALVSNWSSEVVAILGSVSSFKMKQFKPQSIQNPWMSKMTDMNNDKKSDLIISDGDGKQVLVYLSGQAKKP